MVIVLFVSIFIVPGVMLCNADDVLLRCQSVYPFDLPHLGKSLIRLSEQIHVMSEGGLKIKLYPPGKLFDSRELLEAVSRGKIEAAHTSAGFWKNEMPAAPFFTAIPFGPEASEFLAWLFYGNGLKLYQEMYDTAGYNVVVLPTDILAPETSGWFVNPIDSPEDFKGLNIRFFGFGAEVLKKLGASAVSLPVEEIIPAIKSKAIEATEFSCPDIDREMGFYRYFEYNYFPGWHQQATLHEILINRNVWNRLSKSQKKMLEIATRASMLNTLASSEAYQGKTIRENESKHGVTNKYWSDEMLDAFREAWEKVLKEKAAADPFFKTVLTDLNSFRKDYAHWKRYAFLPFSFPGENK